MTNTYEIRGVTTAIFLTGKVRREALIDTADLPRVREWPGRWYAQWDEGSRTFYVVGHKRGQPSVLMHRWILRPAEELEIDHRNHYGLDNRKAHLEACTRAKNAANRLGPNRNSRSGFPGVYWHEKTRQWRSQITAGGKRRDLPGGFATAEEAAAARQLHLEKAS